MPTILCAQSSTSDSLTGSSEAALMAARPPPLDACDLARRRPGGFRPFEYLHPQINQQRDRRPGRP